jgi:hypothetical protein
MAIVDDILVNCSGQDRVPPTPPSPSLFPPPHFAERCQTLARRCTWGSTALLTVSSERAGTLFISHHPAPQRLHSARSRAYRAARYDLTHTERGRGAKMPRALIFDVLPLTLAAFYVLLCPFNKVSRTCRAPAKTREGTARTVDAGTSRRSLLRRPVCALRHRTGYSGRAWARHAASACITTKELAPLSHLPSIRSSCPPRPLLILAGGGVLPPPGHARHPRPRRGH